MSVGCHPLAGIAVAFAAVAGGFGVNFLITPTDAILTEITNESIHLVDPSTSIDLTANLWFRIGSTILVTIIVALVTTWTDQLSPSGLEVRGPTHATIVGTTSEAGRPHRSRAQCDWFSPRSGRER